MVSQNLAPQLIVKKELSKGDMPKTFKNQLLLSPGVWNGVEYTGEEIKNAFLSTDWNDKSNTHLYLDHEDTKGLGVGNWAGFVKNLRMDGNTLLGDLEVWHPWAAMFLTEAKAKFGVSATLGGIENKLLNRMEDFHFESFSIVTDPACRPALINLSREIIQVLDKQVTSFEELRKTMGMSATEFYASPKEPLSSSELPIFDAAQTRNSIINFDKAQLSNSEDKTKAWNNILNAAGKFGIKISKKENSEEFNDMKGGLKEVNMEENKQEEVKDENKESEESEAKLSRDSLKELSEKMDKLISIFEKKSLQEEPEEEVEEEAAKEESEKEEPKEENDEAKKELEEVKKELNSIKAKLDKEDNEPVVKTLSFTVENSQEDNTDLGMLDFLRNVK